MNSKELIRKTLDFSGPQRVGRSFSDSDLVSTQYTTKTYATDWINVGGIRFERTDEWGNLWTRIDSTSLGEVTKGVLEGAKDFDSYIFPNFSNINDYQEAKRFVIQNDEKWVMGGMKGFTFNIARNIFKLENYLCELVLHPERMHHFHDRVDVMLEDMIRGYAWAGVDSIMFWEDWGTQTQTLINPLLWYEEFYPRFKKLCSIAHECGIKVFMHSCGAIGAIIPGLIEAGVDLFQFDQPRLHGFNQLAFYQEKHNVTFWCPVDIQKTLQTKNELVIRSEAKELLDLLWKGRGGFIAAVYHDDASIGLEPIWQKFACDEFIRQGKKENYFADE